MREEIQPKAGRKTSQKIIPVSVGVQKLCRSGKRKDKWQCELVYLDGTLGTTENETIDQVQAGTLILPESILLPYFYSG